MLSSPATRVFLTAWFQMLSARQTLEQCSSKLQELSGNIDRVRSLHSPGVLVAPPPTPTSPTGSSVTMSGSRAPARCHDCHGPLAGYHQGYPHGLNVCQLEHYDLCIGGIKGKDRGGNVWRTCPPDYEPPMRSRFHHFTILEVEGLLHLLMLQGRLILRIKILLVVI